MITIARGRFRSDAQRKAVMSRLSRGSASSGQGMKTGLMAARPMSKAQQLVRIGKLVKVKGDRNRLWVIYGQSDMDRPITDSDVFFIGRYHGDDGVSRLYKDYKDKLLRKYMSGRVGMIRMFNFYNPESRALGYS